MNKLKLKLIGTILSFFHSELLILTSILFYFFLVRANYFMMDTLFSVTDVVFAVLAVGIGLITVFCYYAYKYKEKTVTEDANKNANFC